MMLIAPGVLLAVLTVAFIVLATPGQIKPSDTITDRLSSFGDRPGSTEEELELLFSHGPSGLGPVEFLGLRYLVAGGLGICTLLLFTVSGMSVGLAFLISAVCGILGFIPPNIWIDRKIKGQE